MQPPFKLRTQNDVPSLNIQAISYGSDQTARTPRLI